MEQNVRTRRKKKKSHAGCLVLIGILVGVLVAAVVAATTVLKDVKGDEEKKAAASPVTIQVEQGSGSAAIAQSLKNAGVIRFPQVFRQYLKQTGKGSDLQYGEFTLYPGMSYDEIIETLCEYVKAETVSVTFPEGTTAIWIANKMEEAGLCTAEEFLDEANNGDFSEFAFWNKIETDPNCFMKCEGYLYPETYEFLPGDSVHNLVATFYSHFDEQMTDEMYARMEELGMSLEEVVTLASFVQEEAGNEESANVSAVFHNRLAEDSPVRKLESNACSYIENDEDNNYLWNWVAPYYGGWENIPKNIYNAYDTYLIEGLPAGPISNPGADAIHAALYPTEDFPYYFFVTDLTGKYYYAKTADEHLANCNTAWAVNASLNQ